MVGVAGPRIVPAPTSICAAAGEAAGARTGRALRPPATSARAAGRGRRRPLTLVVAPAGAGKTLLLAGWMASPPIATPGCHWTKPTETAPSCGRASSPRSRRWPRDAATRRRLLSGRAARPTSSASCSTTSTREEPPPSVLVIDDVHLVDDDERGRDSLGLFLQHLPSWLHVVLLSRREPRPAGRPPAGERSARRGALRRAALLPRRGRRDCCRRLAPSLSADRSTPPPTVDGWAAGLQLAALAARSSERSRRSSARAATRRCWSTTTCGTRSWPTRTPTSSR